MLKRAQIVIVIVSLFLTIALVVIVEVYELLLRNSQASQIEESQQRAQFIKASLEHTSNVQHKITEINYPELESYDVSYPNFRSLLSLIKEWNPDNPDPPTVFTETLQHFNYSDPHERSMAEEYRNAEVPFKIYNVPSFDEVITKWTDEYLIANMKGESNHVEKSNTNHFMFWNLRGRSIKGYKPPTELVKLTFQQWLLEAYKADEIKLSNSSSHYYFMTGTPTWDRTGSFISRDLKLFSTEENNFFITDVSANKGIQCRFSMRGIIAESHFDSGKNMVFMVRGAKRYILTPPHTCKKLGVIRDIAHPSYRHSVIDWSDVNQAIAHDFEHVDAIDTVLRAGEVLYIPSYWLHYIVSLRYSIQCNSRSGEPLNHKGASDIDECMGLVPGSIIKRRSREKKKETVVFKTKHL